MYVLLHLEETFAVKARAIFCSEDKEKLVDKKKELEIAYEEYQKEIEEYEKRRDKFYKNQREKLVTWLQENRGAILPKSKYQNTLDYIIKFLFRLNHSKDSLIEAVRKGEKMYPWTVEGYIDETKVSSPIPKEPVFDEPWPDGTNIFSGKLLIDQCEEI
jgi:hypothetical protein